MNTNELMNQDLKVSKAPDTVKFANFFFIKTFLRVLSEFCA